MSVKRQRQEIRANDDQDVLIVQKFEEIRIIPPEPALATIAVSIGACPCW
jgi:hypothetical protein